MALQRTTAPLGSRTVRVICQRLLRPTGRLRRQSLSLVVRQKTMNRFESITIREVESSDLETFYEHQLDPEAIRMAAFVCEDLKGQGSFRRPLG